MAVLPGSSIVKALICTTSSETLEPRVPWSFLQDLADPPSHKRPLLVGSACRSVSPPVTPGVERLRTGACGVVVVVVNGGVTGSEIGRGIC
jgi:hypothetical protein